MLFGEPLPWSVTSWKGHQASCGLFCCSHWWSHCSPKSEAGGKKLTQAIIAGLSLFLIILTSTALLISSNWRWSIILLALQYIGVFLLVRIEWPSTLATVKLIAGWMSGAVLALAFFSLPGEPITEPASIEDNPKTMERAKPIRRISFWFFQLFASILVLLTAFSLAPTIRLWTPTTSPLVIWGGLILIGMGLLKLGIHEGPLPAILGLLTLLAGFEILYATIETSILVAGLLATVNLGLSMVGAYLLVAGTVPEESV